MGKNRFDAQLVVYTGQPTGDVLRALDGFAEEGVDAVTLDVLGWEDSMSYPVDVVQLFSGEAKEAGGDLARQVQGLVEEVGSRAVPGGSKGGPCSEGGADALPVR